MNLDIYASIQPRMSFCEYSSLAWRYTQ
jgi:hypothetical protein